MKLINLTCEFCKKTFQRSLRNHSTANKKGCRIVCSNDCRNNLLKNRIKFQCGNCGNDVFRKPSQISQSGKQFCSPHCSGKYASQHKTTGTRRSKLEIFIEQRLKSLFPGLDIYFNQTSAINGELDIYIPSLKLAFELNGIFHYEPIFGKDKLSSTQNNDKRKYQACLEREIELCIIDVSGQKYFKESSSQKYLDIVFSVIKKKTG